MYSIKEVSDLYADACLRDEAGNLLFASIYGRDGAILQFLSSFSLKVNEGGLSSFTLVDDNGKRNTVGVPDVDKFEKLTGRLPKANLFGNLAHVWLYDKRLVKPDFANRSAVVMVQLDQSAMNQRVSDEQIHDLAWPVIQQLSPVPLLDHWKETLLAITASKVIKSLASSSYPPLGCVTGLIVALDDAFIETVSTAVRSMALRVEPGADIGGGDVDELGADIVTYQAAPAAPTASKFALGEVVMTPGVRDVIMQLGQPYFAELLLRRHRAGDWGVVCQPDARSNDLALRDGFRVLSAYPIDESLPCAGFGANTIWIITEADRSVTTLLLPDEY